MLLTVLLFFAGLLLLYYGADYLVTGSSRLALSYGIRPLVVGMTVVAFATSMPEMLVSLLASFRGSSDIAAGNIVGSNIANIGLILGVAAMLHPLRVASTTLRREIPYMIFSGGVLLLLCLDGRLTWFDGVLLLALLVVFLLYCVRTARSVTLPAGSEPRLENADEQASPAHRGRDLVLILVGIVGLGVGAELMVRSAVTIARHFGISELVIGLTIVALGTSLPELAASVVSAWKGEMDISVGNVIGSNIFNTLFVLGVCPLLRPLVVEPRLLRIDMPIMLLFSVALLPLCGRQSGLNRRRGILLLGAYLVFLLTLFARGN